MMKKRMLVAVLAALLVSACDAVQQGTSSNQSPPATGWDLKRERSQMDGEVVVASKRVNTDGRTVFDLTVKCSGQRMSINITSYHYGLIELPPNAFVIDIDTNIWGAVFQNPQGRAKFNQGQPQALSNLFTPTDYNNDIHFRWDSVIDNFNSIHGTAVGHDEINNIAALKSMLPIVLEVKNETGSHELSIDSVQQVNAVFDACGGDEVVRVQRTRQPEPEPAPVVAPIDEPVVETTPTPPPPTAINPHPSLKRQENSKHPAYDDTVDTDTQSNSETPSEQPVYVSPVPKIMEMPLYPRPAARAGITGTTVVELDIDTKGLVTSVRVPKTSMNRDLDRAAIIAAQKWTFHPATENGQPVPATVRYPVDFKQ